jgi:hypothetical protein
VLIGPLWRGTFKEFLARADGYIPERDKGLLSFVDTPGGVVTVLREH